MEMKNSIATKSAPACSDAPFHTMMGMPCTRMPLVTVIRNVLPHKMNQ